jgi:hypothetical protein
MKAPSNLYNDVVRVWLNFNHRSLIQSGKLEQLIERNEITGITSNAPAVADCIARDREYRDGIRELAGMGMDAEEIYRRLVLEDAIRAADLMLPVFKKTQGRDGFVGIDVSPEFAYDVEALLEEGRRLWNKANRPNVMIQIPSTEEAVPAIRELLQCKINVNAILLNSSKRYRDIARAYLEVLANQMDRRVHVGGFVSAITISAQPGFDRPSWRLSPEGTIGLTWHISSSQVMLAAKAHLEAFASQRFHELAPTGAWPQLLMWGDEASASQVGNEYSVAMELSSKLLEQVCEENSNLEKPIFSPVNSNFAEENGDMEWLLDVIQEETIKSHVVRIDRALESLKKYISSQG